MRNKTFKLSKLLLFLKKIEVNRIKNAKKNIDYLLNFLEISTKCSFLDFTTEKVRS